MRALLLAEEPADPNPFLLHMAGRYVEAHVMGDPPDYEPDPEQTIGRRAARAGVRPLEYVYDLLLADEGRTVLFWPERQLRPRHAGGRAHHGRAPGHRAGPGGRRRALRPGLRLQLTRRHCLQDWVRHPRGERRMDLARAVAELSDVPARAVGLADRGRLAAGYRADLNVIDLDRLHLHRPSVVHDLPAGGRRLRQLADGYVATVAGGAVTRRDGEPTGELPGRLVRGAQPAPV